MDVLAVEAATRRAAEAVRHGEGPQFVEFRTYRFRGHSMADPELYRTKGEVEEWKRQDPILLFSQQLQEWEILSDAKLADMEASVAAEIVAAVDFAEAGEWEPIEDLTKDVTVR
jgi:TPP-dependent pyruvate/acetoin dehydrogenase alpha subunit